MRYSWALFTALVLAEIGYPLVDGPTRARLTVATVLLGYTLSVTHAATSRGWRAGAAWLVAGRLVTGVFRVPLAGLTLAAWDLFLDPQMVAEGYWAWHDRRPAGRRAAAAARRGNPGGAVPACPAGAA